ncbi:MAG TPA: hypothetical protein VL049_27880 [Candidatus Dormibacteraeota bacterium]|nr:hypothetical protein [Candidatus Dormibacteraeota bacterium]
MITFSGVRSSCDMLATNSACQAVGLAQADAASPSNRRALSIAIAACAASGLQQGELAVVEARRVGFAAGDHQQTGDGALGGDRRQRHATDAIADEIGGRQPRLLGGIVDQHRTAGQHLAHQRRVEPCLDGQDLRPDGGLGRAAGHGHCLAPMRIDEQRGGEVAMQRRGGQAVDAVERGRQIAEDADLAGDGDQDALGLEQRARSLIGGGQGDALLPALAPGVRSARVAPTQPSAARAAARRVGGCR